MASAAVTSTPPVLLSPPGAAPGSPDTATGAGSAGARLAPLGAGPPSSPSPASPSTPKNRPPNPSPLHIVTHRASVDVDMDGDDAHQTHPSPSRLRIPQPQLASVIEAPLTAEPDTVFTDTGADTGLDRPYSYSEGQRSTSASRRDRSLSRDRSRTHSRNPSGDSELALGGMPRTDRSHSHGSHPSPTIQARAAQPVQNGYPSHPTSGSPTHLGSALQNQQQQGLSSPAGHGAGTRSASGSFGSLPLPALASTPEGSTTPQNGHPLPRRMSGLDRRVRSEIIGRPRHMSLTSGKRPSIVTGGYESSTDDGQNENPTVNVSHADDNGWHGSGLPQGLGAAAGPTGPGSKPPRKRRATTYTSHAAHAAAFAALNGRSGGTRTPPMSSSQTLQGLGIGNSLHPNAAASSGAVGRRRAQSLINSPAPFGHGSPDFSPLGREPPSPGSRRASRRRPPPLGLSPRGSAFFSTGAAIGGAGTGSNQQRFPASDGRISSDTAGAHHRSTSLRSVREREREREREQQEPDARGDHSMGESSREGRKRHKAEQRQSRNHLAASLGLGAAPREVILSSDQIQDLLNDADMSSAVKLMNHAHRPSAARRPSSSVVSGAEPSPSITTTSPTSATTAGPSTSTLLHPEGPSAATLAPSSISRPYLVSAPPALTAGDWARDRTVSTSSSTSPVTTRNVTPHSPMSGTMRSTSTTRRRSRAPSFATPVDSEGGHVPFTHHVHPIPGPDSDIEEADEPDLVGAVSDPEPPRPTGRESPSTSTTKSSGKSALQQKDKTTRHRLSGLLGLRKKPDPQPQPPTTVPITTRQPAPTPQTRLTAPPARTAADEHDKHKENEMRRAEQERRDQEVAQERRYRALLQIQAHPASQRRAHHAATHLDAYYAGIEEGLEHPPKFNPLAVLRWARRNEEQKELRAKWEAANAAANDVMRNSVSPLPSSHKSGSVASYSPRVDARASFDLRRTTSPLTTRSRTSKGDHPIVAPGWYYTLDDVAAYTACAGRINFFIPPVPESPPTPPLEPTASEKDKDEAAAERGSEKWSVTHRSHRSHRSQRSLSSTLEKEKATSTNGKDKEANGSMVATQLANPSVPSLVGTVGTVEHIEDGGLSRETSVGSNHRVHPPGHGHRAVHSTSGIPPSNRPLSALRAPFEKLGSVARRNITIAGHPPEGDEERRHWSGGEQATPTTALAPGPAPAPGQAHSVTHSHLGSHSLRDATGRFRRSRHTGRGLQPDMAPTSEDEHNIRKLISRGQKAISKDILGSTRRVLVEPDADTALTTTRAAELRNLEEVFARERTRPRVQGRRRSEVEVQTEERIQQVEEEIYAQRVALLHAGRLQLQKVETTDTNMDSAIGHYLTQLDQVRSVFRTAADVDVRFDNLESLRKPVSLRANDDESMDELTPLRADSDRGFGGGHWSAGGGRLSDGGGALSDGAGRFRRGAQRRQSTLPPVNLPTFAYGYQAWPRRSTVDSTLGVPVDPIRRLELACEKAHETQRDMRDQLAETTRGLHGMVESVHQLIRQKDIVRAWTKGVLENIAELKVEKANTMLKIKGGVRPRMWRATDIATDLFARWVMSLFSYGIRIARGLNWVRRVDISWVAWALIGAIAAMLAFFYIVGDGGHVGVPERLTNVSS